MLRPKLALRIVYGMLGVSSVAGLVLYPSPIRAVVAAVLCWISLELWTRQAVVKDGSLYSRTFRGWSDEPLILDALSTVYLGRRAHRLGLVLALTDRSGAHASFSVVVWDYWRQLARMVAKHAAREVTMNGETRERLESLESSPI